MNESLFNFLNSFIFVSPWLDGLFYFSSNALGFVAVAIVFFWWFYERKDFENLRLFFVIFISAGLVWLFSHSLKEFFPSPRPFEALSGVNSLSSYGGGDSFPSGHATFYSALATGFFIFSRKIGLFLAIMAIIIGFARVISGIHFPLDIFGGYLLGTAGMVVFLRIFKQLWQKRL